MAYEIAFRKRVLQYLEEGHSVPEAGKLFGISVWTIRIWQRRQKAGCLEDTIRNRSFKKIDPIKLEKHMLEHPDAYLSELAEVFQCATSSIHEALTKLGFVRKKKTTSYGEQDQKKLKNS